MNFVGIDICGARLQALGSGGLYWPEYRQLVVSDLHLCKHERVARRAGQMLPPYEVRDTLERLERDIAALDPGAIVCLGDSFDDNEAQSSLCGTETDWIARLQQGRDWVWIAGNHDPVPNELGGRALDQLALGPLTFRHIATCTTGEITGHYHPKARLSLRGKSVSRPCFLYDANHLIMPAYGTYTGGLDWTAPVLAKLMDRSACAVLTGPNPCAVPMPRVRVA